MLAGNYSAKKINYFSLDTENAKINHRKKNSDGKIEITPYAFLEGVLTSIEPTEWVFEGNAIPQVKLVLKSPDSDEYGSFECNRNSVFGRDLINRLANIEKIEKIRIAPWLSDEVDGKRFTHCAIRNNDIKIMNKFDKDNVPAVEKITLPSGKVVPDSTRRDNFFTDLIPQIKKNIAYKEIATVSELKEEDFIDRDDIGF